MIVTQKSVLFAIFDMRIATTMAPDNDVLQAVGTRWHRVPFAHVKQPHVKQPLNMTAFSKLRSAKHPMFTKYLDRNMKNHVYCGVTG